MARGLRIIHGASSGPKERNDSRSSDRERERERPGGGGWGGRKGKKGVILKLFRRKKNVFTHIHTHTLTFSDSSNKMGTWCF